MKNYELLTFPDADELAAAAANAWLDEVASARRDGKRHSVALSGGRIAQKFFSVAARQAQTGNIAFDRVHFFWADERCVPPTDPESNFKLADELLFKPLNIGADHIHRLRGELPAEVAVNLANDEIQRMFAPPTEAIGSPNPLPSFDLILLGMGEDGHVASLFPNATSEVLNDSAPFLVVNNSPKPPPWRISLSYRAIFLAKQVWVLISGPGKAPALCESLQANGKTPLSHIIRSRPVKIFSDCAGVLPA